MSKNKGFTLVEILAMLVVLGILVAVSIPNINGMLQKQKINRVINDATNMIETAKIKVAKERYLTKPNNGECIIFSLDYINDNGNIEKGPNGGSYDQFDSFVVYKREGNRYNYYVRLVEEKNNKLYGVEYKDIDAIKKLKSSDIKSDLTSIGITKGDSNAISKLESSVSICNSVKKYYVNKIYCEEVNGKYYDANGHETSYSEYQKSCLNS